jgi:hypothetical protein
MYGHGIENAKQQSAMKRAPVVDKELKDFIKNDRAASGP